MPNSSNGRLFRSCLGQIFDQRSGKSVRFWRLERYSDTSRVAVLLPEVAELLREFAVPVMNEKARLDSNVVQPHAGVACLLHHPLLVRMKRRRATVHLAQAEMNEDQYVRGEHAAERVNTFGEDIARGHRIHVGMDKRRPRNSRLLKGLIWRRMNIRILQNPPQRQTELGHFIGAPSSHGVPLLTGVSNGE